MIKSLTGLVSLVTVKYFRNVKKEIWRVCQIFQNILIFPIKAAFDYYRDNLNKTENEV